MSFELPITVRTAVDRIHRHEYVLPSIQREFVWRPEQIAGLFDSLVRGFPIGSLLFWTVSAEHRADYQFYHFLKNYHERDLRHNPKADLSGEGGITATLDGQQRLTSLYLGLRGTYAEKARYARHSNDAAYVPKRLYVNLTRGSSDEEMVYDFRFRTESADFVEDNEGGWFRVGKVLDFERLTHVIDFLRANGLLDDQFPQDTLEALHAAINERPMLSSYRETSQSLDKVLTIFIRVNSAGTKLSYSDLILSIATAQWQEYDAREEIHRLVDDINLIGRGFEFNKDFVLKTCLMLGEFETRFAAENFKASNMRTVEAMWPGVAESVRTAVRLLASFGYSGDRLPSLNATIPIVYYLYHARRPATFPEATAFGADRERIRRWLAVALLKRTFTGQPDTVLRIVRDAIRDNTADGFPAEDVIKALRTASRTMTFGEDDLDAVLEWRFGKQYTFAALALLYPHIDFTNAHHIDHIHPRSHFTRAQLRRRGVADDEVASEYMERVDQLPNLQMLPGLINQEKAARPFSDWLRDAFRSDRERESFRERNYMNGGANTDFDSFLDFFEARREALKAALRNVVGLTTQQDTQSHRRCGVQRTPARAWHACHP